jgi:GH3 auxin-responsive promoter
MQKDFSKHSSTAEWIAWRNAKGGADEFCRRSLKALDRQRQVCAEPRAARGAIFEDFLDQGRRSAFGCEHDLDAVRTLSDCKRAIPIRDYEGYRGYIERQLEGEPNVLTKSPPYAFLKTSGTTGRPKLVPTTEHWRMHYRGPALYAQWGLYFRVLGLTSVADDTALDLSWERHEPTESTNGFPIYSIAQRAASLGESDWTPPWYDAPWFDLPETPHDTAESTDHKLRLLANHDVKMIVSVNPSKIVAMAEQLDENARELIQDLRVGGVRGHPHPMAPPDPRTARRLEVARAYGGGVLRLPDLWPNLSLIVCWTSASARLYLPWLKRLAPGVAILPFSTTGTEGIVTLPVDAHPSAGPVALNQGFYEFAPCDEDDDGSVLPPDTETLDFDEVTTGGTYRLVMSQANGLYRYDTGDVYRVAGWIRGVPRLEFVARAGFQSSFTGEKLTEADAHTAVAEALGERWLSCPLFTVIPVWDTPPRYVLAIEWTESLGEMASDTLAKDVDAALRRLNVEYDEKRNSGRLQSFSVARLAPGAFRRAAEHRVAHGAAATQIKHHWIQKDAAMLDLINELSLAC